MYVSVGSYMRREAHASRYASGACGANEETHSYSTILPRTPHSPSRICAACLQHVHACECTLPAPSQFSCPDPQRATKWCCKPALERKAWAAHTGQSNAFPTAGKGRTRTSGGNLHTSQYPISSDRLTAAARSSPVCRESWTRRLSGWTTRARDPNPALASGLNSSLVVSSKMLGCGVGGRAAASDDVRGDPLRRGSLGLVGRDAAALG